MRNIKNLKSAHSTKSSIIILAQSIYMVLSASTGHAQTLNAGTDGTTTWESGIDGPKIEFDKEGNVSRIYSKYSQPVTITDRQGIHTAQIIAEEKAKAEIIRFISQDVASGRVTTEIENSISKATQQQSDGASTLSKLNERTIVQNLTEVTTSAAAGTLRGVIVLETGYDKDSSEVWVVVGISRKTIHASEAIKGMINEVPSPATVDESQKPKDAKPLSSGEIKSEVKHGSSDF
jgi:hypothetical protein